MFLSNVYKLCALKELIDFVSPVGNKNRPSFFYVFLIACQCNSSPFSFINRTKFELNIHEKKGHKKIHSSQNIIKQPSKTSGEHRNTHVHVLIHKRS